MLPWWFWISPATVFVLLAGLPLWSQLIYGRRGRRRRERGDLAGISLKRKDDDTNERVLVL